MMTPVSPDYIDAARDAGLLTSLDRGAYVAGAYVDEASGERLYLIEYCDPELLAEPESVDRMLARAREADAGLDATVVRTVPTAHLGRPWVRYLTYLRFDGDAYADAEALPEISIVQAEREHLPLLSEWLVRALVTACVEQGRTSTHSGLTDVADQMLRSSARRSFVALRRGEAVGHVTLLCDGLDDVTKSAYIELLDVLVEPAADTRLILNLLVGQAIRHAAALGLPLLGHVVHPTADPANGKADAIIRSLVSKGWHLDHTYWRAPLKRSGVDTR